MSDSSRKACTKIFGAISSPLRFEILRCLQLQGPLAYSEIMGNLKLDPTRDAGKFAYHLRGVFQTGLISLNQETRKYQLTSLGRMLLTFSQEIEEQVLRRSSRLLVRTSRLTMEEFDRNKIVQSLIREAGVPTELAEKISQLAEERLLKLSTNYLTAPLIREFVNAILIESGLEQYRHELTRLGLPVYDVNQTILKSREAKLDVEFIRRVAADRVIEEYTLLNVLPRKIADAHLSGQIHICNLSSWILKPARFSHDIRSLLHGGASILELDRFKSSLGKPKNLESALLMISNVQKMSGLEVSKEQCLNYFNIFLAPFASGISPSSVERSVKNFLMTVAQPRTVHSSPILSLGIELSMPEQFERCNFINHNGDHEGYYGDFLAESEFIAESVFKALQSIGIRYGSPIQMPHLIVPIRPGSTERESSSYPLLLEAHKLLSEYSAVHFSNLTTKWQGASVYFANGSRLGVDWSCDWELDTLRASILDTVVLNLPRIAYEARGSEKRFFDILEKSVSMATSCLDIEYHRIRDRLDQRLLPVLSSTISSEPYMRLQNSQCAISFAGLYETVSTLAGGEVNDRKELMALVEKILMNVRSLARESQLGSRIRVATSSVEDIEASTRLAEIDVERFGWANVKVQGTKQHPYYTCGSLLPLKEDTPLSSRMTFEEVLHPMLDGGHILNIQMSKEDGDLDDFLRLSSEIVSSHTIGFFTYSENYTHCQSCQQDFNGINQKCPECGSTSLTRYVQLQDRFIPLPWCSPTQQICVTDRQTYRLSNESTRI